MTHKTNLILTRAMGEAIEIGDDITVRLLDRRGNEVRISVQAPPDVKILRDDAKARKHA